MAHDAGKKSKDQEARERLLAHLIAQRGLTPRAAETIPPRAHGRDPRPSFAQEQLWLVDQIQPGSIHYTMAFAFRIVGPLKCDLLARSLDLLVQRHEALRTTFVVVDGTLVQRIGPALPLELPLKDLSHLPAGQREAEAARLAAVEARRPFDLANGPLLRVELLRLAADEHVLLLSMHHIISDAWSLDVLFRELGICYDALCNDQPVQLPDLPIQYADFAEWQRERFQGELLERQLAYWKRQLAGAPPLLKLPTDRARSLVQTFNGALHTHTLPQPLAAALRQLAQAEQATLFMALMAAFQVLLGRYAGQPDLVVGTSIANRDRPEIRDLIGFFVNTLVLRGHLDGATSFRSLLRQMRATALEAYGQQDLPFARLVEELRPERDLSYNPVFQTFFVLQSSPVGQLALPGLAVTLLERAGVKAMFDLMLSVEERPEGLRAEWEYNTDLFDRATIVFMAERFQRLLESIVRDPDLLLAELDLERSYQLPPVKPLMPDAGPQLLSYHQERIWFIDLFETGVVYESHPAYHNLPLCLELNGVVDPALLEGSLAVLVKRHPALRTVVQSVGEGFCQAELPEWRVPFELIDMHGAPLEQALERALEQAARPFVLQQDLPIRAALISLEAERALLVVTVHHLVADRRSLDLIASDLAECYRAAWMGEAPALPALPVSYADYAQWQRDMPHAVREALGFYWRHQLRGPLQALELPESRRRPDVHTFTAATHSFSLDAALTRWVYAFGESDLHGPFTALLALFQVLLHRYSGLDEIVIGISAPGRSLPELQRVVGPFSNLLVIRALLAGHPAYAAVFEQTLGLVRRALAYQDMPFDKLVLDLNPAKDMSRTALFDVLFHFEEHPPMAGNFGLASAQVLDTNIGYGKYDLHLLIHPEGEGLCGRVVYNRDIYDHSLIVQMFEHFVALAEAFAHEERRRIGTVTLVDPAMVSQHFLRSDRAVAEQVRNMTLDRLVAQQARRAPNRIALSCGDQRLSYGELDLRANQLAHYLIKQGVGPDTLVALCVERSPELIVGVLGILKAGGAYLPLDPSYPPERLRLIAQDARVELVLTTAETGAAVPAVIATRVLLDADQAAIAAMPDTPPLARAGANNLAYCIYTSGSTGTPKGVQITHANALSLMLNCDRLFSFSPDDVWTLFHSYCFDFSVWEIWGALLFGGRLAIVPYLVSRSPEQFFELLRNEGVTVLSQTPSAFRQLIAQIESQAEAALPALRLVVFGGEALELQMLRPWFDRFGDQQPQLVNMYGITETTVHVTFRRIMQADLDSGARSVIGGALPDWELYVLDRYGQIAPAGVAGELFVGGAGLARGYLGRPDLTAERFVPDPFQARQAHQDVWLVDAGAGQGSSLVPRSPRLYRSGDLARYLPDGDIEYLGRIDHQVKIRGFRIELGEIETLLNKHPAVQSGVVLARDYPGGERRLVAYVVPRSGVDLPDGALRRFLQSQLPDYMVPGAFVLLEALPINTNGKLDRSALPEPSELRPAGAPAFVAPRTPTEELLAQIWAAVLGLEQVGITDHFFDLGGHSLLATQVIARVRALLRVELSLRDLFEGPTVLQLAQRVDLLRRALTPAEDVPLVSLAHAEPPPLSFAQQRLWFLDQLQPGLAVYNVPTALRLIGALDVAVLETALTTLVARHETLRTTFVLAGEAPVQQIAPATPVLALPVRDLSGLPPEEREATLARYATADAQQPFDLHRGPLLRVQLLRLAADEHVLLLSMHHIVSDGWSTGILLRELGLCYSAALAGEAPVLPPLPVQYADYAVWQRRWLEGRVRERQLAYWKGQLAGVASLELPTDHMRPAVQSFRGTMQTFQLPAELTEQLRSLARAEGVTLFMALLAAWQVLLARLCGQDDIVVGTPVAGRNRVETEGLIGFFVNTLALRSDLSAASSFRELLHQVRTTCLDAYANQDLPFEQVVDALELPRDLSRHPLFQVLFALQNTPQETLALPNLSTQSLWFSYELSKFDLCLTLTETATGLDGLVEYSTDLFSGETVGRWMEQFRVLLASLVAEPAQPWFRAALLPAAELALLDLWQGQPSAAEHAPLAHQAIALQAARSPNAPALLDGTLRLSYQDMLLRSHRLAHRLLELGVGPETRVAIGLPRSAEQVLSVLAVWLAGGAVVPLSPDDPPARRAALLDIAQPLVLLTGDADAAWPEGPWTRLDLAAEAAALAAQPAQAPAQRSQPEHLAYVIFTSGSTGTPKAVQVEHRQLRALLQSVQSRFAVGEGDVLPSLAAPTFDIAMFEQVWPLTSGAAVRLVGRDTLLDPQGLLAVLEESTVVHAVPSLWGQVVVAAGAAGKRFEQLRRVWVGGERVPGELVGALQEVAPAAEVTVLYGPTEGTILSTAVTVERGEEVRAALLGQALGHAEVSVRDRWGQRVGVGVAGEVVLGGAGVARGYLGRADLTAERFVPGEWAGSARYYRTGDRGRWRGDGRLEYVGRLDEQVKLRGYRVELGEVLAAVERQEGVQAAAVLLREDVVGQARLVAYVVGEERRAGAGWLEGLRAAVGRELPEYMVPSGWVELEELPLTPNGKLDRRRLPAPEVESVEEAAPRTPAEGVLAQIWAEVLQRPAIGIHDNFFALGGDSILSIQVIVRARQAGLQITARQIFQHQTVAELAAVAGTIEVTVAEQGLVKGSMPLTPIQSWFFQQGQPEPQHFNQSVLIEPRQPLDPALLERALEQLVLHHDALRLRFVQGEQGWEQFHAAEPGGPLVTTVDLADVASADQPAVLIRHAGQAHASLDLAKGPVLRAVLFEHGQQRPQRLLLIVHHLVVDAVSWSALLPDLELCYQALAAGRVPALPPKTSSFKHWAERLAAYAHSDQLRAEYAYWLQALPLNTTPLPRDHAGRPLTEGTSLIASAALSPEQTRALLEQVPPVYQTQINEVLLAALMLACAPWSGNQLLVDIEGHGREELFPDLDLTRTAGWFTCVYPVALALPRPHDIAATLKAIKEQVRGVPQRGLGYGVLRYLAEQELRDTLAARPSAELRFNYLGQIDHAVTSELFAVVHEPSGTARSGNAPRSHLLEFDSYVQGGCFQLTVTYSRAAHEQATVANLVQRYIQALQAIIDHCLSPDAGGYTPSDFPDLEIDQHELDELMQQLGEVSEDLR